MTRQLEGRNLEIISEAGCRIPAELRDRYPEITWGEIGNVLRHDHHEILPVLLWETCQNRHAALTAMRAEIGQH